MQMKKVPVSISGSVRKWNRRNYSDQTPYIICDKGMYQDLSELCRAGKQIEIITNAVESQGANPWGLYGLSE